MEESYFCISCNRIHKIRNAQLYATIFTTGFYTPKNGGKIHLGICKTKSVEDTYATEAQQQLIKNEL